MLFSGQGIQLSGNVPFVIFEWLVWELPADNQRVSDSVFKVKRIIYIVRLDVVAWEVVTRKRSYFRKIFIIKSAESLFKENSDKYSYPCKKIYTNTFQQPHKAQICMECALWCGNWSSSEIVSLEQIIVLRFYFSASRRERDLTVDLNTMLLLLLACLYT